MPIPFPPPPLLHLQALKQLEDMLASIPGTRNIAQAYNSIYRPQLAVGGGRAPAASADAPRLAPARTRPAAAPSTLACPRLLVRRLPAAAVRLHAGASRALKAPPSWLQGTSREALLRKHTASVHSLSQGEPVRRSLGCIGRLLLLRMCLHATSLAADLAVLLAAQHTCCCRLAPPASPAAGAAPHAPLLPSQELRRDGSSPLLLLCFCY
jgi:hypothetical protein